MSSEDAVLDKLTKIAKNLKQLSDKFEAIDKKLDSINAPVNNDEDKEKMEKAFEKKGIGRPAGSYENKQQQYLKMLNEGKIKQPKEITLEYYKIVKEGDKFVVMG